MATNTGPPTSSEYTTAPSLAPFLLPPSDFLTTHPHVNALLAGSIVISPQTQHILLLRRAAHDSWPLKWEVPGGSVDIGSDPSFVAAAVRELWEETGLRATHVRSVVALSPEEDLAGKGEERVKEAKEEAARMSDDVCLFEDGGEVWAKMTVWVEVASCEEVVITPEEHEEFAWVSEEEARAERLKDGRVLEFVSDGVRRSVLEGFRMWKENMGSVNEA